MQIRPKRSKTPIKLQQKPELNTKKQAVSPKNITTAKSNIVKVQSDNEKYMGDISRQNCQSPVFSTFVGASTHQKTYNSTSDNEISIKIALQLAEHHKKQSQLYKNKLNQQEQKYKQMQAQNNKLLKQKQELEEINNKLEQKYKKIKVKYKELKRNQENQSWGNFNNSARNKQNESMRDKYTSGVNSHRNDNKVQDNPVIKKLTVKIAELQSQILSKNKTIERLCQQISQYEQNTFNILKLVDVLQQKVQQLTMDNNLIKGLFRQNQCSQKTEMDLSFKSGGLGGHSERIYKQYEKLGISNVQSRTKPHIQQNKLKRNYITYQNSEQNIQNYQY